MASEDARLARVFALSEMTREEYVERSKETALTLLRDGRIREAVADPEMVPRRRTLR
jgi:hypothetical protein